jgi:hypothetical protein
MKVLATVIGGPMFGGGLAGLLGLLTHSTPYAGDPTPLILLAGIIGSFGFGLLMAGIVVPTSREEG